MSQSAPIELRAPGAGNEDGGVYFLADTICGLVKIGMSSGRVEHRVSSIQTACPHELNILVIVRTGEPGLLESTLHEALAEHRARREWFRWSEPAAQIVEAVLLAHMAQSASGLSDVAADVATSSLMSWVRRPNPEDAAEEEPLYLRMTTDADMHNRMRHLAGLLQALHTDDWLSVIHKASSITAYASEQLCARSSADGNPRCGFCWGAKRTTGRLVRNGYLYACADCVEHLQDAHEGAATASELEGLLDIALDREDISRARRLHERIKQLRAKPEEKTVSRARRPVKLDDARAAAAARLGETPQ